MRSVLSTDAQHEGSDILYAAITHTLKNSHLFSERVMFRMGTTLIKELGYQMRHPSHRFSTVMFSAISSTFMTTHAVINGDSSPAELKWLLRQ